MKHTTFFLLIVILSLFVSVRLSQETEGECYGDECSSEYNEEDEEIEMELGDDDEEDEDGDGQTIPDLDMGGFGEDDDEEYDEDDEDEEDEEDEEQYGLKSAKDVSIYYYFLEGNEYSFEIGEETEIMFLFKNKGTEEQAYRVFFVFGGIRDSEDWTRSFQNFTRLRYDSTIEPGEMQTMAYRFKPSPYFEPREVVVKIDVAYEGVFDNETYATTLFNSTVRLIEKIEPFDPKNLIIYGFVAVVVILLGIFIWYKVLGRGGSDLAGESLGTVSIGKGGADNEDHVVDLDFLSPEERKGLKKKKKKKKKAPAADGKKKE